MGTLAEAVRKFLLVDSHYQRRESLKTSGLPLTCPLKNSLSNGRKIHFSFSVECSQPSNVCLLFILIRLHLHETKVHFQSCVVEDCAQFQLLYRKAVCLTFYSARNNISKMLMWVFSVAHTGDVLSISPETMGIYLGLLRFSYTTLFFYFKWFPTVKWVKKRTNFLDILNSCRRF